MTDGMEHQQQNSTAPNKTVRFDFECGCFLLLFTLPDGRLTGGLACCVAHDGPYRLIEEIVPLTLTGVRWE